MIVTPYGRTSVPLNLSIELNLDLSQNLRWREIWRVVDSPSRRGVWGVFCPLSQIWSDLWRVRSNFYFNWFKVTLYLCSLLRREYFKSCHFAGLKIYFEASINVTLMEKSHLLLMPWWRKIQMWMRVLFAVHLISLKLNIKPPRSKLNCI